MSASGNTYYQKFPTPRPCIADALNTALTDWQDTLVTAWLASLCCEENPFVVNDGFGVCVNDVHIRCQQLSVLNGLATLPHSTGYRYCLINKPLCIANTLLIIKLNKRKRTTILHYAILLETHNYISSEWNVTDTRQILSETYEIVV